MEHPTPCAPGPAATDPTPAHWARMLERSGYCIIPDLAAAADIARLDAALDPVFKATPFCEGGFYGARTKRFGRLLARAAMAAPLVGHPTVLAVIEAVLGAHCDRIQLNVTQAIEIHPGEFAQVPHRDQDMWQGAKGLHEYLVNVMWPLTPFTRENGATIIWPGSHGGAALEPDPAESGIAAECLPGSAILFLGSTLHHGGANLTNTPRRGIVIGYSLGWLRTYENQFLAYPPDVARQFTPSLQTLIGYRQHRPNLGNYEGQCPSVALDNILPEHLAAIDALRPDQEVMVAEHVAREREARHKTSAR